MNYIIFPVEYSTSNLGEGAIWDAKRQCIYWVDITGFKLNQYIPTQGLVHSFDLEQYISAVVPTKSGKLLVALHHGLAWFDLEKKNIKYFHTYSKNENGNRSNDGKCDLVGRFWIGTKNLKDQPNKAALYCLYTDMSVSLKLNGISNSNGICWSVDGTKMYYIDTPTLQVQVFDYEMSTGTLSNKKICIEIDEKQGWPDGMIIDEEGMLWIAHWGGWQVARWNPNTGEKIFHIQLPVSQPTSCVFGGENLDELYITTAKEGLSNLDLMQQPWAGKLLVCKNLDIKGLPGNEFNDK
ncbi:MAG: SMP-30/gluconolactonase/LRE family protein [Bacteroidota bacterium]|nr:SMP-30/gluconolactonase/LRE family protein [Bacteroidota bacterium]